MRIIQLALLSFLFCPKSYGQTVSNSYGQIVVEIIKEKKPKKIYTIVEITSAFLGGDSLWIKSLEKNLNQSIAAHKGVKKGRYFASARFIMTKDGYLADVQCVNDPGFGLCAEVVRALKKSPTWAPPKQGNMRVSSYRH